jgi:hypothetical protein
MRQANVEAQISWASARRGHGAVVHELKLFMRDQKRQRGQFPDLIVVATDGNCKGTTARKREITNLTDATSARVICAIPDPHVERWLMLDSSAFKIAVGAGCDAPDQKCERDRYKRLLSQAVRDAGVTPNLGGIEYADDIIAEMDIDAATRKDASFRLFVRDLRGIFQEWAQ